MIVFTLRAYLFIKFINPFIIHLLTGFIFDFQSAIYFHRIRIAFWIAMADTSATDSLSSLVPSKTSGLSSEDYCYLKCWVALVKVGKEVLVNILKWGFTNPQQLSLRESLSSIPEYSNSKFKNDFNKDERKKIEAGKVQDFDITLLYTLIQRLCGLVPANEQINVNNASTKEISRLLLKVKDTRNKFAHPLLGLDQKQMSDYVNEMKSLFEALLDEAMSEFVVDAHEVANLKNEVIYQLDQIIQSPLPASTVSEQLRQIALEKSSLAIKEGFKDLQHSYLPMKEISVTPWPFAPCRKELKSIFVKGKIKHTNATIMHNRLEEEDSTFDVDQILCLKGLDSVEPGFILVTGESGSGKSMLMKYITASWLEGGNSSLQGVEQFDFVVFIDCRELPVSSLKEVLTQLMPNTAILFSPKELLDVVLSQKCLFLIDNIDDLNNQSDEVISEISSTPNRHKVIATAMHDISNQVLQRSQNKRPVRLTLQSLTENCIPKYCQMMQNSLPENVQHRKLDLFTSEILTHISYSQLQNPEILSHIFFNWYLSPPNSARCSSLTHILLQSFNLILKKLTDKVIARSMSGISEMCSLNIKLQTFLLELGRIATLTLKGESTGLGFKSTSHLILKCEQLGLPPNIVLSEFLCFREVFDNSTLQSSTNVTFPNKSFQEFCSAYHIYWELVSDPKSSVGILRKHLDANHFKKCNVQILRIRNLMKYLVGLLATAQEEILENVANDLVQFLAEFCEVGPNYWFEILEEAQGQSKFSSAVLNYLEGSWQVEDHGISSLLVKLLTSCPPKDLKLICTKDPSLLAHLSSALNACRTSQSPIKLSLFIYSNFWRSDCGFSDKFLEILNGQTNILKVKNFAGRLSSGSFKSIPSTIKRLALQVDIADIGTLNETVPRLTSLQLLSLSLEIPAQDVNMDSIEPLTIGKGTLCSLDLFGCASDNIEKCSRVLGSLSKEFTRVAFRRTDLGLQSCLALIHSLNSLQMTISSVVVGSREPLRPHEVINITSSARNLVGCNSFKWMHL